MIRAKYSLIHFITCTLVYHVLLRQRVLDGLAHEERPFAGILYGGFILTSRGPYVLEFNARFGDPEAQTLVSCSYLATLMIVVKLIIHMFEATPTR